MKKIFLITFSIFANLALAHSIKYYAGGPLQIITIGHPTLTMVADEVPFEEIASKTYQELIDNMITTMKNAGGVGLAAPQVNISRRLFVMKPSSFKKAEAIINPTIEYVSQAGTKDSSEGCLSIPGKNFKVKRYNKIKTTYFNRLGEYVAEEASGFRAIVFQHEYDHLNGIMISDFFLQDIFISDELDEKNIPRL